MAKLRFDANRNIWKNIGDPPPKVVRHSKPIDAGKPLVYTNVAQFLVEVTKADWRVHESLAQLMRFRAGLTQFMNTQGGYMRTQATILAYDMIDSMRANIPAVTNGNYSLTFATATPAPVNCYGPAANCASGQMAVSDINRWRTVLANYLPSGNGQITTVLNATTTQVTVSVQWLDPLTAERGNEQVSLLAVLRQ